MKCVSVKNSVSPNRNTDHPNIKIHFERPGCMKQTLLRKSLEEYEFNYQNSVLQIFNHYKIKISEI